MSGKFCVETTVSFIGYFNFFYLSALHFILELFEGTVSAVTPGPYNGTYSLPLLPLKKLLSTLLWLPIILWLRLLSYRLSGLIFSLFS